MLVHDQPSTIDSAAEAKQRAQVIIRRRSTDAFGVEHHEAFPHLQRQIVRFNENQPRRLQLLNVIRGRVTDYGAVCRFPLTISSVLRAANRVRPGLFPS